MLVVLLAVLGLNIVLLPYCFLLDVGGFLYLSALHFVDCWLLSWHVLLVYCDLLFGECCVVDLFVFVGFSLQFCLQFCFDFSL